MTFGLYVYLNASARQRFDQCTVSSTHVAGEWFVSKINTLYTYDVRGGFVLLLVECFFNGIHKRRRAAIKLRLIESF